MIDAGDPNATGLPATDIDGNPRLIGQAVDIGAYESPTGDPSLAELNVGLEGNGAGSVTSAPDGIDCGAQCNAVFAAGTEVTLTATIAADDMVFTGWSGACSGTEPTCTLTLTEATVVIATFVQGYPINTRVTPTSSAGTIDCTPNPVPSGEDSLCTARPASGYGFIGWSGDCTSTANHTCTLTSVTGSKTVTAEFTSSSELSPTHESATTYIPGNLLTVTAQFNDTSGAAARGLTWLPELPAGWSVASASGDGSPQVSGNEILFTGNLQLPIAFSYQLQVPEDARGPQQLAATLSYQSATMDNPVLLLADPDPLAVEQEGVVRHSADYQDLAWAIDAPEANRVLVYWRAQDYHVEPANPDGYGQGSGSTNGEPHSADYQPPQWRIDTFEVNRVLGYWRAPSYYAEPQGDDGYAPGGQQGTADAAGALRSLPGSPLRRSLDSPVTMTADATAPQATQSATTELYTAGDVLSIAHTLGQVGDDPLLSLVWVPTLPTGWTLTSVSGDGSPELSPTGSEVLFTAAEALTLPLNFSYSVQVPDTASGIQQISAEFVYQRLGMINTANAQPTPNPLLVIDREDGGATCSAEAVEVNTPVINQQSWRSEVSIQVAGGVSVASGGALSLAAPRIGFEPGFRVTTGGRLEARAETVSCSATADASATATVTASATPLRATSNPADPDQDEPMPAPSTPRLVMTASALPGWLQDHLAALGIATDAIDAALLDADEHWLILETRQALLANDGNQGASDLYRLDLLTDQLQLISVTEQGRAGNGASGYAAADATGELIVFQSEANDLVPSDANGVSDLFLYDLALRQISRLTHVEQASAHPALDASGVSLVYDQTTATPTDNPRGLDDTAGGPSGFSLATGPHEIRRQALADGAAAAAITLSTREDADLPSTDAIARTQHVRQTIDAHHPALSADGRYLAYLRQPIAEGEEDAALTCEVRIEDLSTGVYQAQLCPASLAAASGQARPAFSANGAQLHWHLPRQAVPVTLRNPLAEDNQSN
ncbi:MAG: hypothetical protein C1943_05240 [Halochromatium sp.]|nr:hypothetical protein [Halochromatium sp.]